MYKDLTLAVVSSRPIERIFLLLKNIDTFSIYFKEIIIIFNSEVSKKTDFPKFTIDNKKIKLFVYSGSKKQPAMRNIALKNCSSRYLWFIDDDAIIPEYSIKNLPKLLHLLDDWPEVAFVAGKIIEKRGKNLRKIINKPQIHYCNGLNYHFGVNPEFYIRKEKNLIKYKNYKFPSALFPQGTSMLFKTIYLSSIGGFNEDLSSGYASYEDSEPGILLNNLGFFGIYSDAITVHHLKLRRVNYNSRNSMDYRYLIGLIRNYRRTLLNCSWNQYLKNIVFYFLNSKIIIAKFMISFLKIKSLNDLKVWFFTLFYLILEVYLFFIFDQLRFSLGLDYRAKFIKDKCFDIID